MIVKIDYRKVRTAEESSVRTKRTADNGERRKMAANQFTDWNYRKRERERERIVKGEYRAFKSPFNEDFLVSVDKRISEPKKKNLTPMQSVPDAACF